ncbi:MAG: hypothetical protein ACWA5L_03575 [bacterium]
MPSQPAAKILTINTIIALIAGIVLAMPAFEIVSPLGNLFVDFIDWPLDGGSSNLSAETKWLAAISGGVLVSYTLLLLWIINPLIISGNKDIRNKTIKALLVWFIIDSSGSFVNGFPFNVLLNTLFLLMLIVPMMAINRSLPAHS